MRIRNGWWFGIIFLGCFALKSEAATPAAGPEPARTNPFLTESIRPYQLPPFDLIKDEDYAPAFELGMTAQLKEIDGIAGNPEPATFDNTVVALERSGRLLQRVERVFSNLTSANTDPVIEAVERQMAPKLSAQLDAIHLNGALFARIQALYDARDSLGLDAESKRLVERYYKDMSAPAPGSPMPTRRNSRP